VTSSLEIPTDPTQHPARRPARRAPRREGDRRGQRRRRGEAATAPVTQDAHTITSEADVQASPDHLTFGEGAEIGKQVAAASITCLGSHVVSDPEDARVNVVGGRRRQRTASEGAGEAAEEARRGRKSREEGRGRAKRRPAKPRVGETRWPISFWWSPGPNGPRYDERQTWVLWAESWPTASAGVKVHKSGRDVATATSAADRRADNAVHT